MKSSFDFDQNPTLTNNYDRGPRWFIPGYDASHAMAAVLLCDRIGEIGKILVIGAGGGIEVTAFAREASGWSFTGVDPSAEMLSRARQKIDEAGATDRVSLVRGTAEDAPREAFDAATAFLVLHFLPDNGARLRALREIHARLKHGAPFLMINGCTDMESPRFAEDQRLYAAFARRNGAPAEIIDAAMRMQRENVHLLPPEREEALLTEAGFRDLRLFYVGMWVYGWIASA
jgi:tRNA (cmo5U34)-methyltransferase